MAMGMAMDDLLMMKILSRVPMKDLARFKCVSKHWYALISSLQNQIKVLVKRRVRKERGEIETRFSILQYPFTAIDDDDDDEEESCFGAAFEHSMTHGCSHGIVCFSNDGINLFLYNPATRELRQLPPSILHFPNTLPFQGYSIPPSMNLPFQGYSRLPSMNLPFQGYSGPPSMNLPFLGFYSVPVFPHNLPFEVVHTRSVGIGFGYDQKSGGLKVVRIVEFYADIQGTIGPPRAEVYDLGKDRWREIRTPIPANPCFMSSFDIYHQGRYYWWATIPRVILWFDFTKEVFGIISMPEGLRYDKHFTSLAVLNESIVLLNYPCLGNEKSLDVWKMDKDDVVSWTKLFTIGPLVGVDHPLVFVSSDELLTVDNEGHLTLCNIFNTQHRKRLPMKGKPVSLQASLFDKTALSVKGGHS